MLLRCWRGLLKSAVLKPYRETYYQELAEGKLHKENVEKAVDFYFSDICVSFRVLPGLTDEEKDREFVLNVLANNDR